MDLKVNDISNAILDEFPFVFNNDNGTSVVGGQQFITKSAGPVHFKKGQRVTIGGQVIKYGLYPGSGDKVGWTEKIVTQDMVGKQVAIFTSIEIKTHNDHLSKKQRTWNRIVAAAGGIVEVWQDIKGEIVRLKGEKIF